MIKEAVCAILKRNDRDGLFLAVSRRQQFDQIGFPGGKREDYESCEDTMIRELREETGVRCDREDIVPIFSGHDGNCWVTTYLVKAYGMYVDDDEIRAENDQFELSWVTQQALCDPQKSPFSQYNAGVFAALAAYQL